MCVPVCSSGGGTLPWGEPPSPEGMEAPGMLDPGTWWGGAVQPGSVFQQFPFVPQVRLRQAKVIRTRDPVDCSTNTRYGTE